MTTAQIKKTQDVVQEMVTENKEIFAKESRLAVAKTIQGVRAMFEETYPDPVRVVSMGIPVEQLESNPLDVAGTTTSVEFCGGTHLRRSGHIGDFVLASEEAIAKGIRRIVALTGAEASKALKKADLLQDRVKLIEAMVQDERKTSSSADIVKKILTLLDDVSHSVIPSWHKVQFLYFTLGSKIKKNKRKLYFSCKLICQYLLCKFSFFFFLIYFNYLQ